MHPRNSPWPADHVFAGLRLAAQSLHAARFAFLLAFTLCLAGLASAASNVVEYTYDAAGNITNIQRQTAPGFAITSFSPTSGPVGTVVTIYGTGFSPTPANNAVQFNGTAATVTASDTGSISTAVPTGATTGRIGVTVGSGTATSATDFVVTVPGAPTISSFAPASGAASTSVTVTGTNFDTAAGATTVKLNGVTATATVSSDTSLAFTVPAAAASGKITATTSTGTGTSATDFIVPPAGITAADIVSSVRVVPGGPNANIVVPTVNKNGVVLFDGQANVYYSVQFASVATSPTTAAVAYQVIKPDNTVLQTGTITGTFGRPSIHLPPLPTAGTYSVLLSPGSATLNANVRVEINPVTSVDGPVVASSLDYAFQSARFVFTAAANQHVGIGVAGLAFTPSSGTPTIAVKAYQADGTPVTISGNATCGVWNPQGNCDLEFLALVSGTYTLVAETPGTAFANASFLLSSEVTGVLSADVAQPVTLTRVGQDARYTFTANAGDNLAIDVSNGSLLPQSQTLSTFVYKPDGTSISCGSPPPRSIYCNLNTVATGGTYTVYVDPNGGSYGTFNLTLKQGPILLTSDPPSAFAPAGVAETARFRFAGTAGQNLSVGVAGLTYAIGSGTSYLTVYAPSGAVVGSGASCDPGTQGGYCRAPLINLPATGTYSVVLQPADGVKMSGNVALSAELTGSLASGMPQALGPTRPGQLARYAFTGNAGDSTSVKLDAVANTPSSQYLRLYVYKPDGTAYSSVNANSGSSAIINIPSLPATGTYTVVVDPWYGAAWQGTLLLDPGTAIAVDGPTVSPTTSNAGESLRYTLPLTAGQRVEFGLRGLTYGAPNSGTTYATLYGPTGSAVMSPGCVTGSGCEALLASAPSTGAYSLIVTPPGASTIAGGTFALSTALAGTFVIGDPAQAVAITRPGQTARYTFSGTAAQLLRINWTSAVVSDGSSVRVTVLNPDGSTLTLSSFLNGANGGLDIPSLPTSGTYTVVFDPAYAATMSASVSLVTR